ncbi:MAG: MarR family transcriptional regulator [Aliarcobacter butzleri]|nr:MarR family transcriptional regulator [Aliarcobacter butzleri]
MRKYYDLQTVDINLQKFRKNGVFKRKTKKLTDADLSVLFCIKFYLDDERIKLTDISNRLGLTLPAITHKVNYLESRGLVHKIVSNNDKRIINIDLTEKGNELVELNQNEYYYSLEKLVEFLGEEDVNELNRILEKANSLGKIK